MKSLVALILCFCLLQSTSAFGSHAPQQTRLSEKQKIDMLIAYVAKLNGARFIRNGSEYSPAEAADHLRLKLSKAGDRVTTAREFINQCASKSSMSGKLYSIRTADGRERPSREVLMEQLAVIERTKG